MSETPHEAYYQKYGLTRTEALKFLETHLKAHDPDEELTEGLTLLCAVAAEGSIDDAKILLTAGADINKSLYQSTTPLMFAVTQHENPLMVKYLLAQGADINRQSERGDTALHMASFKGLKESTLELLRAGADTSLINCNGKTAKAYANGQAIEAFIEFEKEALTTQTPKDLPKRIKEGL